jgi:hypothetical protein
MGPQFGLEGLLQDRGALEIIFNHVFVVPTTLGRSQVIFWNFFYPHVVAYFGHGGPVRGGGLFEIVFNHVFVVPMTFGRSQVIFWKFFYPHVGPHFGPGGSLYMGRGRFWSTFEAGFSTPQDIRKMPGSFLEFFFYPHV